MTLNDISKALQSARSFHPDQTHFKFTDEYTQVEHEIQKLSSLEGGQPDQGLIIKNALLLIEQGNNDLLILNYLAFALLEQYQWAGLITGIDLLNERLTHAWEYLYPIKIKARLAAVSWLLERYQRFLATHALNLSEEMLKALLEALNRFEATLTLRFQNELSLLSIIRPFTAQERRLIEEKKSASLQAQKSAEAARQQAEQELLQTLEQNAQSLSVEEYLNNISTAELHELARTRLSTEKLALLKESPFTFAIYKHNRAERWWEYPLSFSEVLTRMDTHGFNWEAYSQALHLKLEEHYLEALISFETFFINHPYFLEVQIQILECLKALGAESALLHMIQNECQELCTYYPDLVNAKIQNKVPVLSKQSINFLLPLRTTLSRSDG